MVEIKAPREIKFRAFQNDKEVKRMLYPKDLVGYADLLFIGKSNDTMQPLYSSTYQAYVPPLRFFLMQYTGLKDKNTLTDIYEGDIIDMDGNIRGNIYESPEIYKSLTTSVVAGMGYEDWEIAKQRLVRQGKLIAEQSNLP